MSWIALKMLVGDRPKFYGIVMGLTFAALLITQQGSIFCGLMLRTAAQITDITGADLWVMDPNVRFIDDVKPMSENNLYRVRGVDGVRWAVPLYKGLARAKLNTFDLDGKPREVIEQVILLGLDDSSMVGAPPPGRVYVGSLNDLRKPDAIIVDKVGLRKLFPGQKGEGADPAGLRRFVGRELEMNDRRAVIVGICEATRTFQSNPVVYTTYSRAKHYVPRERKLLSYVLAKTEPGLDPADVARRIKIQTGLGAQTSEEFMWMTIWYYMSIHGNPDQLRDHRGARVPGGDGHRGADLLQLHARQPQAVRGPEGDGGDQRPDRQDDPAPGLGGRPARLRDRRGPGRPLRMVGDGDRASLLYPLAALAHRGRSGGPHLSAGQPAQRSSRHRARARRRLPRLIGSWRAGR